jgi:hypothetical protein
LASSSRVLKESSQIADQIEVSGTREAIERLVAAEHGDLECVFAETLRQLRQGAEGPALRVAFARLRNQLEAHLAREDQLYYPAMRALRPGHRDSLATMISAHDTLRQRLAEIEASLARGGADAAFRRVESLCSLFSAHEVAEERMLHEIDREIRAEDPAR